MQRGLIEDLETSNEINPRVHKKTTKDEITLTSDLKNVCCFSPAEVQIEVKVGQRDNIIVSLQELCLQV